LEGLYFLSECKRKRKHLHKVISCELVRDIEGYKEGEEVPEVFHEVFSFLERG
jgi:peroxiredoxin family protein